MLSDALPAQERHETQTHELVVTKVALIGAAMSELHKYSPQPAMELAQRTIAAAIADAEIDRSSIDALATTPPGLAYHNTSMFVARLGEHLGMPLRSLACVENGGCSAMLALRWAIHEVESGRARVAVALGIDQRLEERPATGESLAGFVDRNVFGTVSVWSVRSAYVAAPIVVRDERPALLARDQARERPAWVAVQLREHANRNPAKCFTASASPSRMSWHPTTCRRRCTSRTAASSSPAAAVVVADAELARARPADRDPARLGPGARSPAFAASAASPPAFLR